MVTWRTFRCEVGTTCPVGASNKLHLSGTSETGTPKKTTPIQRSSVPFGHRFEGVFTAHIAGVLRIARPVGLLCRSCSEMRPAVALKTLSDRNRKNKELLFLDVANGMMHQSRFFCTGFWCQHMIQDGIISIENIREQRCLVA